MCNNTIDMLPLKKIQIFCMLEGNTMQAWLHLSEVESACAITAYIEVLCQALCMTPAAQPLLQPQSSRLPASLNICQLSCVSVRA